MQNVDQVTSWGMKSEGSTTDIVEGRTENIDLIGNSGSVAGRRMHLLQVNRGDLGFQTGPKPDETGCFEIGVQTVRRILKTER
jgi:hypothetical protein